MYSLPQLDVLHTVNIGIVANSLSVPDNPVHTQKKKELVLSVFVRVPLFHSFCTSSACEFWNFILV